MQLSRPHEYPDSFRAKAVAQHSVASRTFRRPWASEPRTDHEPFIERLGSYPSFLITVLTFLHFNTIRRGHVEALL